MTGDGLEQLASLAHHGARATTFLDHPACWRRAARFSYAEALRCTRRGGRDCTPSYGRQIA